MNLIGLVHVTAWSAIIQRDPRSPIGCEVRVAEWMA